MGILVHQVSYLVYVLVHQVKIFGSIRASFRKWFSNRNAPTRAYIDELRPQRHSSSLAGNFIHPRYPCLLMLQICKYWGIQLEGHRRFGLFNALRKKWPLPIVALHVPQPAKLKRLPQILYLLSTPTQRILYLTASLCLRILKPSQAHLVPAVPSKKVKF